MINNVPGGAWQTGQFYHDYLGSPDMNMAAIAKGFGVDEVVENPDNCARHCARAQAHRRRQTLLIDAGRAVAVSGRGADPADPIAAATVRDEVTLPGGVAVLLPLVHAAEPTEADRPGARLQRSLRHLPWP